jgi:hypothetical protein
MRITSAPAANRSQRQPASVQAHQLNDHDTVVAVAARMQASIACVAISRAVSNPMALSVPGNHCQLLWEW